MKFIHSRKILLSTGTVLLLAHSLFPAAPFAGEMSSTGYTMQTEVFGNGGSVLRSTGYKTLSTIGQAAPTGISRSASYINQAGFWFRYTANSTLKKRTILWLALPAILSGADK